MPFVTIDPEKCNRDGICVKACPTTAIELTSQTELPTAVTGFEAYCLACAHCVAVCPTGAISLDWLQPGQCPSILRDFSLGPEQTEQFLRSRRSIRNFKDTKVAREKLARLLEMAARRGEKGFSSLVEEAVEMYLEAQRELDTARQIALEARGSLREADVEQLREETSRIRAEWR